jgi:hypothetical protein
MGQTLHGLARLFPNGTLDPSFVPAVFVSAAPGALALQPDGKILVCSPVVSTTPRWVISRLNAGSGPAPPQRPRIGSLALLPNNLVQLQITGSATQAVIQSSSTLTAWRNLSTNTIVNGLLSFTDPATGHVSTTFYKLLLVP